MVKLLKQLLNPKYLPVLAVALMVAGALTPDLAFAGTDTTFDSFFTKAKDFLEGSLGKLIALGFIGAAVVAVKESVIMAVVFAVIGLGIGVLPTIVSNAFTATM